jgi:uncharacterized protein YndB with AHSA1/START domain
MKIIESIFIDRPPASVWTFLIDPQNMPHWNPKVKRVSPSSYNSPGPGYCYAITYQMRETARASEFKAEFAQFQPPARLAIRLTGTFEPRDRVIDEIYELTPQGSGTILTQTVQIGNSGINFFFRFLIWAIRRFGKPVGPRYLEGLKNIIEKNEKERVVF